MGSSDSKQKALLKSPQTRAWTSFIEAITATGRALTPGIIFKGKNLQNQWFLNEFKKSANWYLIISPRRENFCKNTKVTINLQNLKLRLNNYHRQKQRVRLHLVDRSQARRRQNADYNGTYGS
jgi:hypothetical protein